MIARTTLLLLALTLAHDQSAPLRAQQVQPFAPGAVTVEGQSLYRGDFSPDGSEFYFFRKVTDGQEDYRIFVSRRAADGTWAAAERVDLGGEHSDLYPTISPDGQWMVFSSYRPTPEGPSRQANLWYVEREGDGWGDPVYMAGVSDRRAYNPGPTWRDDGYVYYKREVWGPRPERDHLRARWTGHGFGPPERDPTLDPFADWRDDVRIWNGVLSPDGAVMILEVSELEAGTGRARPTNLWLSRRQGAGWTEPRLLPEAVNSPTWENFVLFTPDGRDLLFGRGFARYFRVPVAWLLGEGSATGGAASPGSEGPLDPPAGTEGLDLRGTWELGPDGTVVSIYDLRDYMPDGSTQLNTLEPTSGRLRTLHPVDDDGAPRRWAAGPAWFAAEPVEFTVAAVDGEAGRATRLHWEEAGQARTATRIRFPTRPMRVPVDGAVLAGHLILPPDAPDTAGTPAAPRPAMVMVHGSGRATREVPRSIGELFARAGVATFVYDKRGTGQSTGNFAAATVADFAADAAAVVAAVMAHPAVDSTRVGVMVASQGGLLVPDIIQRNPGVALLVCRVCPVLPGGETSIAEARGRLAAAGMADAADDAEAFLRAQQRFARTGEGYEVYADAVEANAGSDWAAVIMPNLDAPMAPESRAWTVYRDFIAPDPWAVYQTFDGPVLGIFGALDARVPAQYHAEPLRTLLAGHGHPDSDVWVLDNATHGLLLVEPEGGRRGPFRRVPAGWHDRLVQWVRARLLGAS